MKPLKLSLHVYQGQTFNSFIDVLDEDGTPSDLTGYSARMQVREDIADAVPKLEWTTSNGAIVITPLTGKVTFNVSAAATSAIPNPSFERLVWQYSLELFLPSVTPTYVERLAEGFITIHPELTREP